MEEPMKSLGLDLSTTVCGFAIAENKIILDAGFFDISDVAKYKEKSSIIINGLEGKVFDRIIIEETLSGFAFGKTSQQVLLKLAKNKAVISYILEEHYKLSIFYANAVTMRKQLFGISRIKGIKPKDFVKSKLDAMYDMTRWTTLNRNGVPDKKMEDVYDAVVIACYEP
jgi:hypothetical protein